MQRSSNAVSLLTVGLAAIAMCPSFASAANLATAPIQSHPHGQTYAQWAVVWWQWALGTPASVNPVLDETGEDCAEGQLGHVWFLAGTFGTVPASVVRTCTIPTGTALFFPLINSFYGAFLNDSPETRTEDYIRSQVACEDVSISAQIDGVPVENPLQNYEQSPLFDVQLPTDNVFGFGEDVIPKLLLSPSVDAGYYLFLHPLPPGSHTIHWVSSQSCPASNYAEEVTYHLTVR
jgi:hypothetical protein